MTAGLLDRLRNTRPAPIRRLFLVALGVSVGIFQLCGVARPGDVVELSTRGICVS
jgi:hypothetical protein